MSGPPLAAATAPAHANGIGREMEHPPRTAKKPPAQLCGTVRGRMEAVLGNGVAIGEGYHTESEEAVYIAYGVAYQTLILLL